MVGQFAHRYISVDPGILHEIVGGGVKAVASHEGGARVFLKIAIAVDVERIAEMSIGHALRWHASDDVATIDVTAGGNACKRVDEILIADTRRSNRIETVRLAQTRQQRRHGCSQAVPCVQGAIVESVDRSHKARLHRRQGVGEPGMYFAARPPGNLTSVRIVAQIGRVGAVRSPEGDYCEFSRGVGGKEAVRASSVGRAFALEKLHGCESLAL